jgi:hypothetical protein
VLHVVNRGPGRARELGRLEANGEFLQYLDSDDRLLPGKFAAQVGALRAHPECGVAYGTTRLIDAEDRVLNPAYKWSGRKMPTLFPALLVDRWWSTHTPLYRREVCDTVGPWTNMWMGEDWEYDARVAALGTQLVHCGEIVSEHRQHTQPRLTGGMPSVRNLENLARVLLALHRAAEVAGVARECAEMRHFSRWAFSLARQTGAAGLKQLALACFDVAVETAPPQASRRDLRAYRHVAAVLGWKTAGRAAGLWERAVRKRPGRHTLPPAWATP